MTPTQHAEIYCLFCRARLRWYYGWYCPVRWPFLGEDEAGQGAGAAKA